MTIQYCSDLHLEFPDNAKYLQKKPLIETGEILVLAGDIMPFTQRQSFNDFIDQVSDNYEAVYWIPGNHEYYGSILGGSSISLFEKIRPNFFLVNNQTVIYKNAALIFSTLWSPITPQHEWEIRRSVADYRAIKMDDRILLPADVNGFHEQCRSFLEKALLDSTNLSGQTISSGPASSPEFQPLSAQTKPPRIEVPSSQSLPPVRKRIVITHHVPTLLNYPPKYKRSDLTEAFAVELHDFVENSGADYWIYGHHHVNIEPFRIGRTELLTNQLGYVSHGEQRKFRRDAVITLS